MIQPLLLDNTVDSKHIHKEKVKSLDFLLELLKNIDDKKVIKDLILHSNIDEKSKELLLNKFHISKSSKETKNFLNKFDQSLKYIRKNKESLKLDVNEVTTSNNIKILNSKNNKKEQLNIASLLNSLKDDKDLEKKVEVLPLAVQWKVVKEIKNILEAKVKNNKQIEVLVNSKEFKNVTNIKDLLNLSKKFELNITKIILKHEDVQTPVFSSVKTKKKIFNIPKEADNNYKFSNYFNKKVKEKSKISLNNKIKTEPKNNEIKKSNVKDISLNSLLTDFKKDKKHKEKIINDNNDNNLGININTEFKSKIIEAKQSIKHFVSSLKEAVENYKPPLTKLSLELHPKELGKVEVVIKQQGDNLNVQINTQNQTTINFLTSQQNELKNSLVNMGFTNINMNFNSNHQHQKHNQHKNQYTNSNTDENNEELVIDFSYKYA